MNNISDLPYWIECDHADEMLVKSNSLSYKPTTLGKNIIKPTKSLINGKITDISELNYYNDIPVSAEITNILDENNVVTNDHGIENITDDTIYRHSGYYMPLFYNIELFATNRSKYYKFFDTYFYANLGLAFSEPTGFLIGDTISVNKDDKSENPIYDGDHTVIGLDINNGVYVVILDFSFLSSTVLEGGTASTTPRSIGNYKFDTTYTNFGIVKQRVISKVNRKENLLKLKNSLSYKSIYPMLDEFGYTTYDFFMFKSTWDNRYHVECYSNKQINGSEVPPTSIDIK
jgi:hypothetical protein